MLIPAAPGARTSTTRSILFALMCATLLAPGLVTASEADPSERLTLSYGGPFTLTDHHGREVTDESYRGEYLLVYFGYTSCPDVCPTTLGTVAGALHRLGPMAEQVRPLFISVDPRRDTPERLAAYVRSFNPRMVGLTGTPEQINKVARAYHAHYFAGEIDGRYLVDHTGSLYLMGPDGGFLKVFPHGVSVPELADGIRTAINDLNHKTDSRSQKR